MLRAALIPLSAILVVLAACAPVHRVPTPSPEVAARLAAGQRHAQTTLFLTREGPAEGHTRAVFDAAGASDISVTFVVRDPVPLNLRAVCDGPARAIADQTPIDLLPAWQPAGQAVAFDLGPRERFRTRLALDPSVTHCALTVTPGGARPYALDLWREDLAVPDLAAIDGQHAACHDADSADPLQAAFLTVGGLSASCPVPVGRTRLLADGLEALNAKVEALTGRRLTRAQLLAGDADMALDFSNAPRLDLINISYLNLNADFAGYLVARMLAWHAERGTTVRILVSDIMLTETDRRLFENLAARYPTVQIQPFRFPAEAARGLEGQLGRLHRVTHVKLFATVAREPGRSSAMIGGRNLHEGYFYHEPRDLTDHPQLHQYDPSQIRLTGGFTAYEDFEIEFRSDAAVRAIVAHMGALWQRDHDSQTPRPPARLRAPPPARDGLVRHFLSVPYADGEAQEAWFARVFDAAQDSIHIAIPYLNMPPQLEAALSRARDRGVDVRVVTTVRVREATDFVVTGLNRQFANDFGDWVEFFDYDPEPRLLHAKLFVIDGRLAIVTSTNLNMRSFVHDMENGVAILDRGVARGVDAVIESYIAEARRVLPGQEVPGLVRWLRRVATVTRAF